MAEEIIYTSYSVEDIENYLHGRMNAKEMHNLEKTALQDAFLADAIEGYRNVPFGQTYRHLNDIESAILGEKQPAKIVAMPVKANYWWRVAAVIGVVIVAGGLWYAASYNHKDNLAKMQDILASAQLKTNAGNNEKKMTARDSASFLASSNQPNLATSEKGKIVNGKQAELATQHSPASPAPLAKAEGMSAKANDGVSKNADSSESVQLSFVEAPAVPAPAKLQPTVSGTKVNSETSAKPDTTLSADESPNRHKLVANVTNWQSSGYNATTPFANKASGPSYSQSNALDNNNALARKSVTMQVKKPGRVEGFVVDDNKKPLGNAMVYSAKGMLMTVTDANGYFKLNTNDSALRVEVSSAGYETKQAQLKNNITNHILINQSRSAWANVDVVEIGLKAGKAKSLPVADSLFPEGGWQSFRDYVFKRLHQEGKDKDIDTSAAEITTEGGSIEIEFTVDNNGFARNLKVTKSVNKKIDAKAVEVVQQWPRWIATRKDKKAKVVIQF